MPVEPVPVSAAEVEHMVRGVRGLHVVATRGKEGGLRKVDFFVIQTEVKTATISFLKEKEN